ncbi:hypothetical protein [Fredinandcohnia sp. 179-A 10B2 NHS]|uniref:DMP19 family protein n=1 Tax=Fredinandcohnia sp. 179-A 10B2 NHS TaxID=3235176 RepID=UPI0039A105DA
MKTQIKSSQLQTNDDIWNAVIHAICECDFPTENELINDAYLVFQFYSELESGGFEALFNWWSEYIQEVGIHTYVQSVTSVLEKIGAYETAVIFKKYGEDMWSKFVTLETDEIDEEQFYEVIEKANSEYYALNDQLQQMLESYFVRIHTKIIEIID